jgi:hypothetical protein
MILPNFSTGGFEVYDIVNNQITSANGMGTVGLDWSVGGFAADPPTGSMGNSDDSTSQLVQAMAGFGGSSGAADTAARVMAVEFSRAGAMSYQTCEAASTRNHARLMLSCSDLFAASAECVGLPRSV